MPSDRGTSWSCDRCGLEGFRSYEEARTHEIECDPTLARKRRRPVPQSYEDQHYLRTMGHVQGSPQHHIVHQYSGGPQKLPPSTYADVNPTASGSPPTHIGKGSGRPSFGRSSGVLLPHLLLPRTVPPPPNMDELDLLVCQNIELFQATPDVAAEYDSSVGGIPVSPGQIGLRCVHCARNSMTASELSSVFPAGTESIDLSLQLISDRHFSICRVTPEDVRARMEHAANVKQSRQREGRRGENDNRNRIALLEFCANACKRAGVVNRYPPNTGLVLRGLGSSEGGDAAQRRSSMDAFSAPINSMMQPTPVAPKSRRQKLQHQDSPRPQPPQMHEDQDHRSGGAEEHEGPEGYLLYHEQPPLHYVPPGQLQGPPPPSMPPPPGSYDGPGSSSFPFFQDGYAWICKYCASVPMYYRAPNSVWQAQHPPGPDFIDQHLNQCRGVYGSQGSFAPTHHSAPQYGPPPVHPNFQPHTSQYGPPLPSWGSPPEPPSSHPGHQPPPQVMSTPPHPSHTGGPPIHYAQPEKHGASLLAPYQYQKHGLPPTSMSMHSDLGLHEPHLHMTRPGPHHMPTASTQPGLYIEGSESAMQAAIDHLNAAEREHKNETARAGEEITELVLPEDKALLTHYFFHLMKQLCLCRFSETDRKTRGGKRENVALGYGGLQCIHCSDTPNSRKFYWSNVDRLANSFAEIPGHVLKCRRCPNPTKAALQELKRRHPEQMARLPRGSQKVFFRRMWRRLHDEDPDDSYPLPSSPSPGRDSQPSEGNSSALPAEPAGGTTNSRTTVMHTPVVMRARGPDEPAGRPSPGSFVVGMTTETAAMALAASASSILSSTTSSTSARVLLAIDEDKEWLSDMDCFVRQNLEVFCANNDDIETAQSDRKYPINLGQVGIRCIHCATSDLDGARGTAVSFPYSISGIYESVREFQRLHLESCPNLPEDVKTNLLSLKGSSSLSSVLRRYYIQAAKALGMHDTSDGIVAGGHSVPIGLGATYDFASSRSTPLGISESTRIASSLSAEPDAMHRSSGPHAGGFIDARPAITPLESRKRKQASPPSENDNQEIRSDSQKR